MLRRCLIVLMAAMPMASIHAPCACAQSAPETIARAHSSRVRALDRDARWLLETAVACSPTIARSIVALQQTDLIVGVETRRLPRKILGELRFVSATPGARYLRIAIKTPNAARKLMSVLGHELQHALEVAAAPEVQDAGAARSLYRRIGYEEKWGASFETAAALEAGRRVAAEVAAAGRGVCRGGDAHQ